MTSTLFRRRESNVDSISIFDHFSKSNQSRRAPGVTFFQRRIDVILHISIKIGTHCTTSWTFSLFCGRSSSRFVGYVENSEPNYIFGLDLFIPILDMIFCLFFNFTFWYPTTISCQTVWASNSSCFTLAFLRAQGGRRFHSEPGCCRLQPWAHVIVCSGQTSLQLLTLFTLI